MITKHWVENYALEGREIFTCPTCRQVRGAVAGDTHIGTRYDNGRWDSQGWRVLKCGHGIGVYDYADGTRQIIPSNDLVKAEC